MAVPVDVIPRRPTLLFIVVLSLLFVLMSLSTRTRYVGETRTMFERTVMTIFSPVPKLVNWIGQTTADAYHGYLDMRRAVNENLEHHRKVIGLTTENLKMRQSEGDVTRLRSLLGYADQFSMPTTMSQAGMRYTSDRAKQLCNHQSTSAASKR